MTEQPQALVDRFVQARDAIRAAFRMESDYMYPVCASVFLAADRPVEPEELDRCKRLVKESVGIFSNFRGNIKLPLICMLAAGDDPEDRWEKTQRAYALLKERVFGSEYLALAALLLSDAGGKVIRADPGTASNLHKSRCIIQCGTVRILHRIFHESRGQNRLNPLYGLGITIA